MHFGPFRPPMPEIAVVPGEYNCDSVINPNEYSDLL